MPSEYTDGHLMDVVFDDLLVQDILRMGPKGLVLIALIYEPCEMGQCRVCREIFHSEEEANDFQLRCAMYYLSGQRN